MEYNIKFYEIGGSAHWIRSFKALSYKKLIKTVNKFQRKFKNRFNYRMFLHSEDPELIRRIMKKYENDLVFDNEIVEIGIEFLMDGMPVFLVLTKNTGESQIYDFHDNLFEINVGDAVYNFRDDRYYIRRGCTNKDYTIGLQLWDLFDYASIVSYIDLRKVSDLEYNKYKLNKLNYIVNEVQSQEEDDRLIDELSREVPRLDL